MKHIIVVLLLLANFLSLGAKESRVEIRDVKYSRIDTEGYPFIEVKVCLDLSQFKGKEFALLFYPKADGEATYTKQDTRGAWTDPDATGFSRILKKIFKVEKSDKVAQKWFTLRFTPPQIPNFFKAKNRAFDVFVSDKKDKDGKIYGFIQSTLPDGTYGTYYKFGKSLPKEICFVTDGGEFYNNRPGVIEVEEFDDHIVVYPSVNTSSISTFIAFLSKRRGSGYGRSFSYIGNEKSFNVHLVSNPQKLGIYLFDAGAP